MQTNGTTVEQGTNNMRGLIKNEYEADWFVPLKSEWSAFGGEVLELNNITSSNYGDYKLSPWRWSSSQYNTNNVYNANFNNGYIKDNNVNNNDYVCLTTSFIILKFLLHYWRMEIYIVD